MIDDTPAQPESPDTQDSSAKIRLFFAYELSDDVRAFTSEVQSKLITRIGPRDVRWTQPVDMHITALFLGDYPNERLPKFTAAATNAATRMNPFDFTISGLGQFPPNGPARVLWVGGREPEGKPASALTVLLRQELRHIELDKKPFKPHITLGYVRPDGNRRLISAALEGVPASGEHTLRVTRLVLMQTISDADRRKFGNARYNIVQVFPFAA